MGRWWRLVVAGLIIGSLGRQLLVHAADSGSAADPAWANPTAKTVKLIGPATDIIDQPNFQSNLDCTTVAFRQVNTNSMQNGCFMPTAYGEVDPDSDQVIFNGTDEALPLTPYSPHQVLTPWPGSTVMLTLDATNTGGSYLGMYKDVTAHLQDQRDLLAQLKGKQVTAPPDISIVGPDGKTLVINVQSMAFSAGGSWLVAETLNGSFVRINLATQDILAFAPTFGSQGSPGLLKSQVAISSNGRYVAIENTVASSFKVYDLSTCSGAANGLAPLPCSNYDYWPYVSSQISGVTLFTHVRFVSEGLVSFDATTAAGSFTYLLAPMAGITNLINYLGLGDSFTSGEGAFDYLDGTDTGDNVCHLSLVSYPLLLAKDVFTNGGHSVACSGARIQDVMPAKPDSYPGQVRGGIARSQRSVDSQVRILADYSPGYLPQADFVSHYQPSVITISIGGNDVGFGDILLECVVPHISLHISDEVCFDTYEDRLELKNLIDRTISRWVALNKQLLAKSPGSRLYVVGYPQIAIDDGSCGLNVHLNKSEIEFSEEIISYLNGALAAAATQSKLPYVDISQALAGHRLCEATGSAVAVNGLTAGTSSGPFGVRIFGKESYHPSALGQELIEAAILRQTNNFRQFSPSTTAANDSQNLLNLPKSGRAVNSLVPDDHMASLLIPRGQSSSLQIDGVADGLIPQTVYTVRLDGSTGPIITTATSDSSGNILEAISLPSTATNGGHTLDVIGPGQAGQTTDVRQPIYVPVSSTDADGDGVADAVDSCPAAVNSGVDSDDDGVDDVCDPMIAQLSSNSSGPSSPATSSPVTSGSNTSGTPAPSHQITASVSTGSSIGRGPTVTGAATQPTQSSELLPPKSRASTKIRPAVVPALRLGGLVSLSILLLLLIMLLLRYLKYRYDESRRRRRLRKLSWGKPAGSLNLSGMLES